MTATPSAPAVGEWGVHDETSPLRTVIVHRPGREMERLTPETRDHFLFDEILWVERAQEEHDRFAAVLRSRGAEVLYVTDLLREALADEEARRFCLGATLDPLVFGDIASQDIAEVLGSLEADRLADILIAGATREELQELGVEVRSLSLSRRDPSDFVLNPLPNHLFSRDASAWVANGVAVNAMQRLARRRESIHMMTIYRHHPRFAASGGPRMWSNGHTGGPATVEGGDVLVLSDSSVLIGLSERTTPAGVERLAGELLGGDSPVEEVIALAMPHQRSMMHLDTVMTVVDQESVTRYAGLGELESFTIRRRGDRYDTRAHAASEMDGVIARGLGVDSLRVLTPELDRYSAAREQWDDGCNLLAVAPGVVVGYERATASNQYLRDNGVEVLEVAGSELGRGRGGPRCMSCPVLRG